MKKNDDIVPSDTGSPEEVQNQHQIRTEATKERILAAAHTQFVTNGLEGARMEAIAATAEVNKSLVYRHFTTRENLYRLVLQRAYENMRRAEAQLALPMDPVQAVRKIVAFTLHYYIENPDFLVLVGIENLNQGQHLREVNREALGISSLQQTYAALIEQGLAQSLFREGLSAMDLYTVVASQCWFAVATRYTFGVTFEVDTLNAENIYIRESLICDNVLRWILRDDLVVVLPP